MALDDAVTPREALCVDGNGLWKGRTPGRFCDALEWLHG